MNLIFLHIQLFFFSFFGFLNVDQSPKFKWLEEEKFSREFSFQSEDKTSSNLIFEETFENESTVWNGIHKQLAEGHSFCIVNEPVYQGKQAGKFELRQNDRRATKNGLRAEVLFPIQEHPERWYSFAVYFPSAGWLDDMDNEVVTQWHSSGGTPTISLRVKNGDLRFRIGHDPNLSVSKWAHYSFGKLPKDEWIEFVFHIIHSENRDGLVEVWKNSDKVITHLGPNRRPDTKQLGWKIGIYKSSWARKSTLVDLRVTYFDNIRMGNEYAKLEEMRSNNL